MRLGYFVASYGGILLVLGLAIPIPTRFQVPTGGSDPVKPPGGSRLSRLKLFERETNHFVPFSPNDDS